MRLLNQLIKPGLAGRSVSLLLCLAPLTVAASKNFGGSSSDNELRYFFLGLVVCSAVSFALSICNLRWKRRGIAIITALLTLPLLLSSILLVLLWPPGGFFGFMIVLLHGVIIYRGFPQKKVPEYPLIDEQRQIRI